MTVLKENTGSLTGRTGVIGWIIIAGLIAFGFSLISFTTKKVTKKGTDKIKKEYGNYERERVRKKQKNTKKESLITKISNIDIQKRINTQT